MKNLSSNYRIVAFFVLWFCSIVCVVNAEQWVTINDNACLGSDYHCEYQGAPIPGTEVKNIRQDYYLSPTVTIGGEVYHFSINVKCLAPNYTREHQSIEMTEGASFTWHGKTYTQPGVYLDTTSYYPEGCPKDIAILALEEKIKGIICDGGSFTVPGVGTVYDNYKADISPQLHSYPIAWGGLYQFYTYTHVEVIKYKATYTLETKEIEEVEGATFEWHGKTYTQPGVYLDTISSYPEGCPKEIVILSLNGSTHGAVCNGVPFVTPSGISYGYAVTNYKRSIQWYSIGGIGFTTYELINVVVGQPTSSKTKATITDGDSYTWFGKEYTTQGTYHDTISNAVGCDSIGTLILGVCSSTPDTGRIHAAIFEGDYFYYQGVKYTTETHKVIKYATEYGCDSIIKLDVEVLKVQPGYESYTLCEGESYDWHGIHITESGQYEADGKVLLVAMLPIPHVDAGGEVTIKHGETLMLHATGADYYEWTPDPTLTGVTSPNPEVTPKVTTTYYVKSHGSMDDDLVVNGDFSAGNTGYYTDGRYTMDCGGQECCGTYVILPSTEARGWSGPYDWQQQTNQFDHTVGDETGAYMIWDGFMETNKVLWQQTVTVQPNTAYVFSAWFASLFSSFEWGYTKFQFFVNGVQLGETTESPHKEGLWGQYYQVWNSGNNTTVTLTIKNQNSGYEGNDFGLDDISFQAIGQCQGYDSVKVIINFDVHLYPSCGHSIEKRAAHEVAGMTDRTVTFSIPGYCTNQSGIYLEGDQITVYAHDEECRVFSHWSDGNTDNPRIFTVGKSNFAVQAIYTGDSYTITTAQVGEGTVTGGKEYNCNETATITATPDECWKFVKWQEDGDTNPVRTFTVTEDRTLTAIFEAMPYAITIKTQDNTTTQGGVIGELVQTP